MRLSHAAGNEVLFAPTMLPHALAGMSSRFASQYGTKPQRSEKQGRGYPVGPASL
jgi:hypothetical protein